MLNVLSIRFRVGRFSNGRYHAACDELGAYTAASTLPQLEEKLRLLVSTLLDEVADAVVPKPQMLVSRLRPARPRSRTLS
jgi:hypothetical protein